MGTTNTRVWAVRGPDILARAQASVGVRDTARDGSPARMRAALREAIEKARQQASAVDAGFTPAYVAAAGMITSPLGLLEIPHIAAPAGAVELAAALRQCQFPDVCELPFIFVPGIRFGPRRGSLDVIVESDVMRGEETLCVGLAALGLARPPATILNIGSHWKAIHMDAQRRIHSSVTSLSGELIHAAQTQTILASAVPHDKPLSIDLAWCEAGMREQRRSGLPRALFCVRLLEMGSDCSPEERLSFLVGVFVAADLDALLGREMLGPGSPVLICGGGAVAEAWRHALDKVAIQAFTLHQDEIERALLAGLRSIVSSDGRETSTVTGS
jgi:2-dehydro-3-deoxygalactonokinase